MEKNPAECKHSFRFGDIYVCKLQTVPCAALNRCAMDDVNKFVDAMSTLIKMVDEQPKEET